MGIDLRKTAWGAALLALPALAHAHTGAGIHFGFMEGVMHPLMGADHLLAMVAVGLWAAQGRGRTTWRLPAAFVLAMGVGGMLGMGGLVLPFTETGILLSVLVLGLLIAGAVRLPQGAGMAIVAGFALFHGNAHGVEIPGGIGETGYAVGFLAVTALLHAAGMLTALGLQRLRGELVRLAGAAIATGGALLAIA